MYEIEWALAQQRREPTNLLAMVGELDWRCELFDAIEEARCGKSSVS
jgi:hypothetical protein